MFAGLFQIRREFFLVQPTFFTPVFPSDRPIVLLGGKTRKQGNTLFFDLGRRRGRVSGERFTVLDSKLGGRDPGYFLVIYLAKLCGHFALGPCFYSNWGRPTGRFVNFSGPFFAFWLAFPARPFRVFRAGRAGKIKHQRGILPVSKSGGWVWCGLVCFSVLNSVGAAARRRNPGFVGSIDLSARKFVQLSRGHAATIC